MVLILSKPSFPTKRSKAENISFNNWTICSGLMWAESVVKPTKSATSTVTSGWLSAMLVSPFFIRSAMGFRSQQLDDLLRADVGRERGEADQIRHQHCYIGMAVGNVGLAFFHPFGDGLPISTTGRSAPG